MPDGKSLKSALLSVQARLKCPKSAFNSFGKYAYRSCEDILEAAKPLLAEDGLCLTLTDSMEFIDGRHYVKATATVWLADAESSDSISVSGWAREPQSKKGMDESQITGMASSYARKYALNALFLIDDTKDADAEEQPSQQQQRQPQQRQPQAQKPIWDQLLEAFYAKVNECGYDANDVWGQMSMDIGFSPTPSITQQQFQQAMGWVNRIQ